MDVEEMLNMPVDEEKPRSKGAENLMCLYIRKDVQDGIKRRAKKLGYKSASAYVADILRIVGDAPPQSVAAALAAR